MSVTRISFSDLVDLASERVGGKALVTSDDFFAPKENLLKSSAPIFIPDKYTEVGKWMDGWESRRKRVPGYDWCLVRLGLAGVIRGVVVDTSHFLGNYPEYCSIEGAELGEGGEPGPNASQWREILPKMPLAGGTENAFAISSTDRFTHLKLNIFPDGGVARLRVYGDVVPDWEKIARHGGDIDLAALENGGRALTCNDMFFSHKDNLIFPGRSKTMGDGWETRRRRGPGNDWIILKLGKAGKIKRVELDTSHFKGNFPESCSIEGCRLEQTYLASDFRDRSDIQWVELLPRTKLKADTVHEFKKELRAEATNTVFDYVRLQIYPDGGVGRLRLFGEMA